MARRYAWIDINSSDQTDYLYTYKFKQAIGLANAIDIIKVKIKPDIPTTPNIGDTIEITSGYNSTKTSSENSRIFYGMIIDKTEEKNIISIQAESNLTKLRDKKITAVYSESDSFGGVITTVAEDLIETYGGMTANLVSHEQVIKKFVCEDADILERLQTLMGLINYDIRYDHANDEVILEPQEYQLNTNTIYIGSTSQNASTTSKWRKTGMGDLFNKIIVKGATVETTKTQTFTADGSTTQFTLDFIPSAVTVTVDGTQKLGGIERVTDDYDYTVDVENKIIEFTTDSTPTNGQTVSVDVTYKTQVPIEMYDQPSIDSYTEKERRFTFTDIKNVADAQSRATKLLENHRQPYLINSSIKIKPSQIQTLDISVGQKIRIIDAIAGIDDYFVIKSLDISYPENGLKITASDKEWKWQTLEYENQLRIKRLEEQVTGGSSDVLLSTISETITTVAKRLLLKRQIVRIDDSFVLSHPINGVLNRGIILDAFDSNPAASWTGTNCTVAEETI